jgi:hypothetical protein
MRRISTAMFGLTLLCSMAGCTVRNRRPDGPYQLAEEFTDALSDEAVDCTREHSPSGAGDIVVAAELTPPDQAPVIHDLGSMPGSEAVLACIRERAAQKLRCPPTAPAPFVRVRVPVPLVTAKVTYAFLPELPSTGSESPPAQP